ncbi:MAG TPA: SDR family NAD(P)-dependent oxidoreductase [Streptosporangiaceae bacterium]|jgi:acyl transferase domain-containing protein
MTQTETQAQTETDYASAVALIGMSGRFPGANSVTTLWENLRAGVKGLRELTDEELAAAGVGPGQLADPSYVRIGGPLAGIDQFDAAVFGISPREAESMDPQHRLFLECTWEALEAGGYCPTDTPGHVGVFAGCGFPDYIVQNIQHLYAEPGGMLLIATGNERDSLASFVAYKLGLNGPAIGVQTFCSTSMIAVHLACQSLLTYECDIALAGGAFIPLPQPAGYRYEPGGIASPDGVVRSFDAEANGTVMGAGVGAVALKRMSEALADGDVIHAVILGSAANNDGRVRAGYTAPGVDGQAEVIELAMGVAGVKPETVGYVECHATATPLGDSIELAAMNRAFPQARETACVLGTLKPSLGHLDRASGVSALIRASLALEHETLPGTPNYATPNPALATATGKFTVLTEHQPWPAGPVPRRAGVSSFGLGGTNAHVVLEQAPVRPPRQRQPGPHLLTFSAGSDTAMSEYTQRLRDHLQAHPDLDLADVAFTLQVSRGGFALRRAIVCEDTRDAIAALADETRWMDHKTRRRNPKVVLMEEDGVPAAWRAGVEAAAGGSVTEWLGGLGVPVLGQPVDGAEIVTMAPDLDRTGKNWLLATVGRLWLAGCAIDWAALHDGAGRRVELPTYPFQRQRYWVDPKPMGAGGAGQVFGAAEQTGRSYDRSGWTYQPTWQARPCAVAGLDERVREAGPWLVFAAESRGEAIAQRLSQAGADVTVVRLGEKFAVGDDGFTVRPAAAHDMRQVLASFAEPPRSIVHGFSLGAPDTEFGAAQEHGFYSVLALATELVDETGAAPRAELVLLTSGAAGVAGGDLRHPEHATVAALPPSLAQENPRLRSRSIDVDEVAPGGGAGLEILVTVTLAAALAPYEGPMAVRAGEPWLRRYQPFPTEEPEGASVPIRDGDTVLITGGLGDIGLVLARHLAGKYGCKLVLTARSPLPPREQWAAFAADVPPGQERTARHIKNIQDLEQRGADVLAVSADAADADQMRAVVDAAVQRFGRIDVAVHAAGVQDARYFNYAHMIDRAACEAHFASKVTGFGVLQQVLGDQAADRRLTFSSLAAVLGGIVLAPYAAANAALDAYARLARAAGAGRWITVDWDTWSIDPDRLAGHGPGVTDYAMVPAEALDVFERALASGDQVGHLVISTGSLAARIQQWVTGDIHDSDDAGDDDRERHPRPDLSTPYQAPAEGTETILAEIWSGVLGIEPVGALDNFFELGGHSLVAISITARIRKTLGASVPITGLLESPTVRALAALIDRGGPDAT